ncbi:UvrD-helicase domain-containing protein [Marinicellulosiphila megalodicopiae]|uniref:UvrD-helicase domain-containing protein n=1 Tax=Marinicellulosiphila megalodicopiae TaxID=2724896 RepID=UPI003BB171B3
MSENILNFERGSVVAPAGCGKTHLIVETLRQKQTKPYLVLTHTTAGVAALKQRLKRLNVSNSNYVISTIDGWALRLSNMFPASCGLQSTVSNPRAFYPELRTKVNTYISKGHITDILKASYSRVLVDEYQDCDMPQHNLISSLSELLPTIIFGDPMQCIFNFDGPMPSWESEVMVKFPVIMELNTPWRWINSNAQELGEWILNCRKLLLNGHSIDLLGCPNYVHWNPLSANAQENIKLQTQAQYSIRNKNDDNHSLLVIGDSINVRSRHNFASLTRGIDVVEPVDLGDITDFALNMDLLKGNELAFKLLEVVSSMMTGVGLANLKKRIPTIMAGRNRTPATELEVAVRLVIESNSIESITNLLNTLECHSDTRIYRNSAFSTLKKIVVLKCGDSTKTMVQASETILEQRRHLGDRRIPLRAIGSTLLLKGLESDHSLILDASAMSPSNLYVALSRGARSLTVFSKKHLLP